MRYFWALFFALIIGAITAPNARAHELRPAYLSITETSPNQYDILWKTPALGEKQLALKANFPENCTISNGARSVEPSKFAIETWTITCPQSLRGQSLTIGGLEKTLTDVLVRVQWSGGDSYTARLTPDNTRLDFSQEAGGISTYFTLGLKHILGGIDHLLFVLAVMLLITGGKKLLLAITAFTLGHSVTLALASFDLVRIAPSTAEVLIAMSIALMAYEVARRLRGTSGLTLHHPWIVTFGFGLLHGFGFAGALRAIGLPAGDLPAALLLFNIGVEAGQLLFVGAVIALVSVPALKPVLRGRTAMMSASYAIGTLAVFWTLQRGLPLIS